MNRLKIGTVTAFLTPDEISITPDDRQELVKTLEYSSGVWVPSVVAVDGGHCEEGAVMTLSGVKFRLTDWGTIYGYWTGRTSVSVADATGTVTSGCRVVVKGWKQSKRFKDTITADLEVWQV